ncbi:FAD-binding oxidoreductase [Allokutzneria sp. A3M-2-11 16]|uniref:FAD-binding oxidoreductase n=1 Tax=Allokutzneria sp. A3M-2-11 16 TaxID=2962043 RepID=UPI0020B6C312|nr:FAD-binding oxidoreductase [Allokutzneria sp. A3M-2-11 16]MCP3803783.1 FAD-binding oxidoreductase [Allokutzneria sp. A3M-2-11 16]
MSAAVTDLAALIGDLEDLLGPEAVSVDPTARRVASTDWAHMSPILSAKLPAGLADVVAYPGTPEQIAGTVRLAHRHRVPVTPRGQGTGNYGQGIPLRDGLVVDTSRCARVLDIGPGWIRAEAGVSLAAIEAAARREGQEIAIMPSTVGSAIAGFIAGGSGGTGSIENGFTWDEYVHSMDIAPCTDEGSLITVDSGQCAPHIHAYGVTGVIATATVTLVPKRDWIGLFASFAEEEAALAAAHELLRLDPAPRILSVDEPGVLETYPKDKAIPAGRFSVRAVIDRSSTTSASRTVTCHGGTVEAVRDKGAAYLASLSFNHVTHRARKARPELCHLQVHGEALTTRPDEVRAVLPETLLHLDGFRVDRTAGVDGRGLVGMLLCRFDGADALYAGIEGLNAVGVEVHDPHTWLLHNDNLNEIREAAQRFDPEGLLNPGKLPPS